jgi:hypothetical protein
MKDDKGTLIDDDTKKLSFLVLFLGIVVAVLFGLESM